MEDIAAFTFLLLFVIAFAAVYVGSVAWAIRDAQKRGRGEGLIIVLFWLLGPLAAIVWLLVRPATRLDERAPGDYPTVDDAIAAAAKLETLGDWSESIALYHYAAERWPEHATYIQRRLDAIAQKQALAET
jgi:hypothetical protein